MATSTNSLNLLTAYGSDEESSTGDTEDNSSSIENTGPRDYEQYKPADPSLSLASSISIDAAPVVLYSVINKQLL